jgi:predicted HTH domain antitoxin
MPVPPPETEIKIILAIPEIPEAHRKEAEQKAKEAYIMTLLKYGDLSSGRAGELLGIPRVEVFDLMGKYGISVFDDSLTEEELEHQVARAEFILAQHDK